MRKARIAQCAGAMTLALTGLVWGVSGVMAEDVDAITKVRFAPVEVHRGDPSEIQMLEASSLGDMPVPIVEDSGGSFVKVLLPNGEHAWLNRADVRIGAGDHEAVCAKARRYASGGERSEAHLRGVSRACDN